MRALAELEDRAKRLENMVGALERRLGDLAGIESRCEALERTDVGLKAKLLEFEGYLQDIASELREHLGVEVGP